jgi:hypothetical protein
MKNILRPILVALLCCALPATAPAQAREPEAIVKSLYESTMKDSLRPGFGVTWADRKLLTTSLRTLWDKADKKVNPTGKELGAIEFDLISLSQDPNIASYSVKTETSDAARASITATFVIGPNHTHTGQKEIVHYDFLREKGAWKIDNIRASIEKKPFALRAFLESLLKP